MSGNDHSKTHPGPSAFTPDEAGVAYEDDPFANFARARADAAGDDPGSGTNPDAGGAVPPGDPGEDARAPRAPRGVAERGNGWGALALSALSGIVMLALGLWVTDFVTELMAREGWLGWLAFALVAALALAALMLALREVVGLMRLRRLAHVRSRADEAVRQGERRIAQAVLTDLANLYDGRDDMQWALANLKRHRQGVLEAHDLMALADRELAATLDGPARAIVAETAKRVSVLTALSPSPALDMAFVAYQTLHMMRRLAALYGGQPGFFGLIRLARRVISHIIVTGGIALTLDLAQDMIGKRVVGMVAGRLGEGLFNGALTARLGLAAMNVCRPLPHLETRPPNIRAIIGELTATQPAAPPPKAKPR